MNPQIRKLLRKLVSPVFISVSDLIELNDLRGYTPTDVRQSGAPRIHLLTPLDLEKVREEHGRSVEARFRERLASSSGYLALDGDGIVGWLWTTQKKRLREGDHPFFYPVTPSKQSTYLYDAFTVPNARRRGVMRILFRHVLFELKQAGSRCVFFTHDRNNTAMQRLAQGTGFTVTGCLTYHRWLGWQKQEISDLEKICALN